MLKSTRQHKLYRGKLGGYSPVNYTCQSDREMAETEIRIDP